MKAVLTLLIFLGGILSGVSQGWVTFVNSGTFSTVADRNVYFLDGTKVVGSNYVAALFFGTNSGNVNQLAVRSEADQSLLSAVGHFRNVDPSALSAGVWFGGTRYALGTLAYQTVMIQIRVWDISRFQTFEDARAGSGVWGESEVFQQMLAGSPEISKLEGLRAFTLVPEPSTLMLGAFGVGALLVLRRKARL